MSQRLYFAGRALCAIRILAFASSATFAQDSGTATAESNAEAALRESTTGEQSVRPGINDGYLSADLDVDEWLARFEIESREVYAARGEILAALKIKPGSHIADVGAGTGYYSALFSRTVGPSGWVYAVDIAPQFIDHIAKRARADGLTNISTVLCQEDSVALPPRSIDLAFTCDVYHHFEFPQSTLRSIRRALRPGGRLVVVDFERIPGKSRDWTLSHVRAGKKDVRAEVEQAGFVFESEPKIEKLAENYVMVFRLPK